MLQIRFQRQNGTNTYNFQGIRDFKVQNKSAANTKETRYFNSNMFQTKYEVLVPKCFKLEGKQTQPEEEPLNKKTVHAPTQQYKGVKTRCS